MTLTDVLLQVHLPWSEPAVANGVLSDVALDARHAGDRLTMAVPRCSDDDQALEFANVRTYAHWAAEGYPRG